MNPFRYVQAQEQSGAVGQVAGDPRATFLAGGTTLLDLMKLGVQTPATLVDINRLPLSQIDDRGGGLLIGALVTNSDLAYHARVRERYPVLSEAILSGASPYFRTHQPRGLIAWGEHDQIFPPARAEAYRRDLKTLEYHLLAPATSLWRPRATPSPG